MKSIQLPVEALIFDVGLGAAQIKDSALLRTMTPLTLETLLTLHPIWITAVDAANPSISIAPLRNVRQGAKNPGYRFIAGLHSLGIARACVGDRTPIAMHVLDDVNENIQALTLLDQLVTPLLVHQQKPRPEMILTWIAANDSGSKTLIDLGLSFATQTELARLAGIGLTQLKGIIATGGASPPRDTEDLTPQGSRNDDHPAR